MIGPLSGLRELKNSNWFSWQNWATEVMASVKSAVIRLFWWIQNKL